MADSTNGSAGSGTSGASSSSSKRRVEYIAKVKYQNSLPPPPFPPKLVTYDFDTDSLLNAGSLSSVFLQGGVHVEPDVELGMPLDLSLSAAAFDPATSEAAMCPPEIAAAEMDPEDLDLLGDPVASGTGSGMASAASVAAIASANSTSGAGFSSVGGAGSQEKTSSSEIGMGTAFLRRTAYMTGDTRRTAKRKAQALEAEHGPDLSKEVRRIEQTFEDAQVPLDQLKHPSRSGVHAVKASPLFPDLKEFDLTFVEVRTVGSASLRNLTAPPSREQLSAAVFRKSTVTDSNDVVVDNGEWVSLFVPADEEEAAAFNASNKDLRDTLPGDDARAEEERVWPLNKVQDNEFNVIRPQSQFEEIVITESQDGGEFYFVPIANRLNLKRRRLDFATQQRLQSHETDVLDLSLRELSPQESMQRDEVRSIYDPVNYG